MIQFIQSLILICLLLAFTSCKGKVDTDYSALSEKNLIGASWESNPYSKFGYAISFEQGNKYKIEFSGEGCGEGWIGEYELKSPNQVLLKKGIQQVKDCGSDKEEIVCDYKKESQPVYYQYYLQCGQHEKYWSPFAITPSNVETSFEGNQVISLSGKSGVTTDDAKLRAKPDVNSKSFNCSTEIGGAPESKPFIPKNTQLVLLFKTKEKQKVQKWENYWYYAYVQTGWYGGCDSPDNQGWIFGEFVKEDK